MYYGLVSKPFSSKVFKEIKRDGEEMNKSDAIYHINAAPCHVFGYACTFLVKAYGYVKKNFAAKKWPLEEFYAVCRGEVNVWGPSYGQKMHRSVLLHDIIIFVFEFVRHWQLKFYLTLAKVPQISPNIR